MPNCNLVELLKKGVFNCIFRLNGRDDNTMSMVQVIFADLYASWVQKHAGDKVPDEEIRYQFAVNELEKIMAGKKGGANEVFQLLGDLTMCSASESKECLFWFIEHYILTNVSDIDLRKHYKLLARIALAFTEFSTNPVIRVIASYKL